MGAYANKPSYPNKPANQNDPNNDGDTSDSVADKTLVIFQSDNGGPGGPNNTVFNANGGLRGTKGKIQEGGIRVPLVMRWPAKIGASSKLTAGTNCDTVVDVTDLLPTFCELAGAPIPLGIDGVSLAPTLLGVDQQRHREFIIHEASNGQSIIRGNHKLVRTRDRKKKTASSLELYDLQADHAEEHNLAQAQPEVVKELEALLLGERVTEPKGFANTYHHWIGKDGAPASDAGNWSDYAYANEGVTYLSDDGAPRLSWTALLENSGRIPNSAHADRDLEFLGLEIRGSSETATQSLALAPKINLTGRNEIRLGAHGSLVVANGTVSSLRWIDVQAGGQLKGAGTIDAILNNNGTIAVSANGSLQVNNDYHEAAQAVLKIPLNTKGPGQLRISGQATLGGLLGIATPKGFSPKLDTTYTILTAQQIVGTFRNPGNQVRDVNVTYSIRYSDSRVTLTLASILLRK